MLLIFQVSRLSSVFSLTYTPDIYPYTPDIYPYTPDIYPYTPDIYPYTPDIYPYTPDIYRNFHELLYNFAKLRHTRKNTIKHFLLIMFLYKTKIKKTLYYTIDNEHYIDKGYLTKDII